MDYKQELGERLDVKEFLVRQIHQGASSIDTLVELLVEEFRKIYTASSEEEVQTMASIWVENLYDEVYFEVMAEDEEATDEYRERESALIDAVAGRW